MLHLPIGCHSFSRLLFLVSLLSGLLSFTIGSSLAPQVAMAQGSGACAGVTEIPQSECQALVTLYTSTQGTAWTVNNGWLVTNTPCSWYGITCAGNHVTMLMLPDNGLSGSLPPELGALLYLRILDLAENEAAMARQQPSTDQVQPALTSALALSELSREGDWRHEQQRIEARAILSNTRSAPEKVNGSALATQANDSAALTTSATFTTSAAYLRSQLPLSTAPFAGVEAVTAHGVNESSTANRQAETTAAGVNQLTGPLPASLGNLRSLFWLDLSGNQLSGPLPPELGLLTSLTFLDLYHNAFSGAIPVALTQLPALETLDLGANGLTGPIPSELSDLVTLKNLGLCGNGFTGAIPPSLGRLVNLTVLFLCYNQLSGPIPAELGAMTSLQALRLDVNRLSGAIPTTLGALTNLQILRLETNTLSGPIPTELGQLTHLTQLWLTNNQLSGAIPASVGQLQQLNFLSFTNNRLSGPIPPELGQLTKLIALSLSNNRLSGPIPASLGALTNLFLLDLQTNELSGAIPTNLGNLRQVTTLSLAGNLLTGAIPESLTQLTGLTSLTLHNNLLSGALPAGLGNLVNLQEFAAFNNRLTGPIPAALGKLSQLQFLMLSGNQLSGEIPPQLGNLTALVYLWLGENRLTGPFPDTFGALHNLGSLWLYDNHLSGPLPSTLGQLTQLTDLRLSANLFSGEVPAALGNLHGLTDLWLYNNQLSGPLPSTLGALTNLRLLWLSGNSFSGPIPASLGQLANLENLWLNGNNLSGAIPPELGNLSQLQILWLHENQLSGAIPPELGNLQNLVRLELDLNQLSGEIPATLAQLQQLTILAMGNNQLSGPIPPTLGNLVQLRTLWLNDNQLDGPLPATLGQMPQLTELSLQRNRLTGTLPPPLGTLTNLARLQLSGNRLSGSLPAELGNLVNLLELNVAANDLHGALPPALAQLHRLVTLNLAYNQLTAADETLLAFLDAKAPAWRTTQTLPPTALQALPERSDAIALSWTPIAYDGDGGAYQVEVATQAAGPYTVHGRTVDKRTPGYTVDGLAANTTYYFRVRTYTPAGAGQPNEQWSDESSVVTATTTGESAAGDGYESDDTCPQARAIVTNGDFDTHTFHQPGDVDWVQFTVRGGIAYRIEVQTPVNSTADVALKRHAGCNDPQPQEFNESFSPGVQLTFVAPVDGVYALQLRNVSSVPTNAATYQIAVRALDGETQSGAVILVGGRLYNADDRQPNIDYVTALLYQTLVDNGYSADNIYYLSTKRDNPGVDAAATLANLQYAITTWAKSRVDESHGLTLYMIDHGDKGIFYVDDSYHERLTTAQLAEWLERLEESVPHVPVNIFIEACYSGSFINGAAGTISKPGRVVITSASLHSLARASEKGAYFSDYLFTALRQGHHLFSGFWEARLATRQVTDLEQDPWLDADGDGVPNELEDAAIAARRALFPPSGQAASQLWPPYIATLQETAGPTGQRQLQADVRDNRGVARVWAVIYPPDYVPPADSNELTPENAPKAELTLVGNRYVLDYPGFTQLGRYRVVIHAQDTDGLQARPAVITINTAAAIGGQFENTGLVYLPIIAR